MILRDYLIMALTISAVCLSGFGLITQLISNQSIIHFDADITRMIQALESPFLTHIMNFFTFIGSAPFVIILCLFLVFFLYYVLHHRLELFLFITAIIGSTILNGLLKQIFQRVRPDLLRLIEVGGYSFPSGHAMNAFTVYGIISFLLWRHIPNKWGRSILLFFGMVITLAIGTSRIYLGVHYPSDIIGGYLASGFWVTTSIFFFQLYKEKRYNKKYLREKEIL